MHVEITVTGMVQGVGYRFFVLDRARVYGVRGFVRNAENGSVEVIAEADEGALNAFIDDLRVGPRAAQVDDVRVVRSDRENGFADFRIKP